MSVSDYPFSISHWHWLTKCQLNLAIILAIGTTYTVKVTSSINKPVEKCLKRVFCSRNLKNQFFAYFQRFISGDTADLLASKLAEWYWNCFSKFKLLFLRWLKWYLKFYSIDSFDTDIHLSIGPASDFGKFIFEAFLKNLRK